MSAFDLILVEVDGLHAVCSIYPLYRVVAFCSSLPPKPLSADNNQVRLHAVLASLKLRHSWISGSYGQIAEETSRFDRYYIFAFNIILFLRHYQTS